LEIYKRQFEKMRIQFPEDVDRKVKDAEEFSRTIKKKLSAQLPQERRASLSQLKELLTAADNYVLITPDIDRLV